MQGGERMAATARTPEFDEDEPGASGTATGTREPDYYAVLGLTPAASADDIRQAFRRLAKLWHPDHYATAPEELRERAERRMRALTRAYEALSDPIRKHEYDREHGHADGAHAGMPSVAPDAEPFPGSIYSPIPGVVGPHIVRPTVARADEMRDGRPAPRNTNGAGYLAGTLCLIIVIAIVGRTLGGGGEFDAGAALALLLAAGLGGFALLLFSEESPVARAANAYMDGEPRMPDHARHRPDHAAYLVQGDEAEGEPPSAFELLVDEALAGVPRQFQSFLENVVVRVMEEPTPEQVERMKLEPCSLLLGLYEGVPLTEAGADRAGPKVVTIFQRPIEQYCGHIPSRIRRQVRATVLHELAHHFGIDHDDMPAWIK